MTVYKCDLCGKLIEDFYLVSGMDIYEPELKEKDIKQVEKVEVKELCEECYAAIKGVAIGIYIDNCKIGI